MESPFVSGPSGPRPGSSPSANPNVVAVAAATAAAAQFAGPLMPFTAPSASVPRPFSAPPPASSHRGPPPALASRPPPSAAFAAAIADSNGHSFDNLDAPRISQTTPAQRTPPENAPTLATAPPSVVLPRVHSIGRSTNAAAAPVSAPLSLPFARPQTLQTPLSGPRPTQPPFARPPPSQRPISVPPTSQPPLSRPSIPQQPAAGPPTSQSFGGSSSLQPFSASSTLQPPLAGIPPSQPTFARSTVQPPLAGILPSQLTLVGPTASQPTFAGSSTSQPLGRPPIPQPYMGIPTSQPYAGRPSSPLYEGPLPTRPFSGPPTTGAPFEAPAWSSQPQEMAASVPGFGQTPPRMFSMPPRAPGQTLPSVPSAMGHLSLAGSRVSMSQKINPNQVPRPLPSSSIIYYETRQGNQANFPPPANSNFIANDTGNCSPRLMRCTMNKIPCTGDLLSTSSMPLALLVQPLALLHPSEEPIEIVDFGENGPIRCSGCGGYINPFFKFIDHGEKFICNLCGSTNVTPQDYYSNLGQNGRRHNADKRPELCRGTVEFVATRQYMVRDPMPAVFFFLVDVSVNAVQTGATAAACSAISQSLADLPDGPRTMVGIATFDCTVHFYNLTRSSQQPLMLIVPDIDDVYTPLHMDIIVQLTECRQSLEQLLENIPGMFGSNKIAGSAFGAAIKAGFLALKPTGGKLLVFQSVLPSVGIGSLSSREAEGRTNVPASDKVCVDIFVTTQTFVDIASISIIPRTTGGQVYYYYPFSALSDPGKLYNDLKWNISRPQGFEAVMRVRCSRGLEVQEYSGNFCKSVPSDIDLPGIDSDKTIMVTFKHEGKLQVNSECTFQCALLYTTVYGQRRIRVINLSLTCTDNISSLCQSADLDAQFTCLLKQGKVLLLLSIIFTSAFCLLEFCNITYYSFVNSEAYKSASSIPMSPLSQVRQQITDLCINILHSHRKYCATVSSFRQSPETLELLPLYTLALSKSVGLRNDGSVDDRSYWVSRVASLSVPLAIPLVYPRMISLHDLATKEENGSLLASTIFLSSEHIKDDGIYLLENGEDGLIYIGNMANQDTLQQLFGVSSVEGLPSQLALQQFDNPLSKKLNDVLNEIRQQRCSYLRLWVCRKGAPSGLQFLSYMVDDKTPGELSYVEFYMHVQQQIKTF
ncbi:hypothetical protein ZIOFF_000421 [Zingiber officinale]|uniref:Protein transport protein Sec24-like CEF n=1 Tax=Zingiber officinale TaxID=94328 RepID=A0A8J5IJN5_ZINOF|nr:hypothetical protein ZIOFF_000421 [Zingiber officinale]